MNHVVKSLQETFNKQAEVIKQQRTTIDKYLVKLTQHEHTVNKQDEHIKTQQTFTNLNYNEFTRKACFLIIYSSYQCPANFGKSTDL